MPIYQAKNNSSITSYEVNSNFLIIRFKNGTAYHYWREDNGDDVIDQMIAMAEAGEGLNSYLRRYNPSWR